MSSAFHEYEQESIPLPPGEDELPYSDGEPMESELHRDQMLLLIEVLRLTWADRDDFYVGGNQFVYFSTEQLRNQDFRGPDVFVVLDTVRRVRKSWVVWQEGRLPDVVIELLSDRTEHIDRGLKMDLYAKQLKVSCYVLYDPDSHVLEAYRLDGVARSYEPIAPDARGDVPCPPLGLRLGVRPTRYGDIDGPMLRWLDAEGAVLPSQTERADEEAERARKEAERADEEAERARKETERARKEAERAAELQAQVEAYAERFGPLPDD